MDRMTLSKLTQFEFNGDTNTYVYPGVNWTYELLFDRTYSDDMNITIDYHDSTCVYNEDFTGPTNLILKAGSDKILFNINIFPVTTAYDKILSIRADFNTYNESHILSNNIISMIDSPLYVDPIKKGYCKKMIGLKEEYQEKYCNNAKEGDYFRYTGPVCRDMYFWKENRCGEFFSLEKYPMLYL